MPALRSHPQRLASRTTRVPSKRLHLARLVVLLLFIGASANGLRGAERFYVTAIEVPEATGVNGINVGGQVVGSLIGTDGQPHGFVWSINSAGVQEIIRLPGGALFWKDFPASINSAGQVCGRATTGPNTSFQVTHAVMWAAFDQPPSTFGRDCPWGDLSFATGINDLGEVIGRFGGCPPNAEGENSFFFSAGGITPIGSFVTHHSTTPGGVPYTSYLSTAMAINNSGVIVGQAHVERADGLYERHVFRVRKGSLNNLEDMGTLGGWVAEPHAINNSGVVVGDGDSDLTGNYTRAFRTPANQGISPSADLIPTLGGTDNSARSINNADQVVGSSSLQDGAWHAFLYEDGVVMDLNELISSDSGWDLIDATAINDNGFIIGHGLLNGETKFFLLRPLGPDLIAESLSWNTTIGGLDAHYQVKGGLLRIGTTAKVYAANGASSANTLSTTPVVAPQIIPVGTGGQGVAGNLEFHLVPSTFIALPMGTTHLLLVLDQDNAVREPDENNNVYALELKCSDAIGNGSTRVLNIIPRVFNNGKSMEIVFKPASGLTLANVASICGYDHFNWLQIVTASPRPEIAAMLPIFDPQPIDKILPHWRWHDIYPFYWDEGPVPFNANPEFVVGNQRNTPDAYTFRFEDTPFDLVYAGPGSYMQFRTFLVGMRSITDFDLLCFGSECGLEWKSDNNGTVGTGVEFSMGNLEDTAGGTGGIYNVREFGTTELSMPERVFLSGKGAANVPVYQLSVQSMVNSGITISWPTNATSYSLEYATSISDRLWSSVTNLPAVVADRFVVTLSAHSSHRFFRLRKL